MDPNATLKELRELSAYMHEMRDVDDKDFAHEAIRLGGLFEALDGWIVKQGFLPGDWTPDIGKFASERAFEACRAALDYDKAIEACASDPSKMASFCTATGDNLDTLYADWQKKAKAALEAEAIGRTEAP